MRVDTQSLLKMPSFHILERHSDLGMDMVLSLRLMRHGSVERIGERWAWNIIQAQTGHRLFFLAERRNCRNCSSYGRIAELAIFIKWCCNELHSVGIRE